MSRPPAIPSLLEKMSQGYDLVIGSRYLGDANSEDDDMVTGFGNWLFTKTVNLLHGGDYTDAMVIYRAFRRDLIYELDLHKEESYTLPERLLRTIISWNLSCSCARQTQQEDYGGRRRRTPEDRRTSQIADPTVGRSLLLPVLARALVLALVCNAYARLRP